LSKQLVTDKREGKEKRRPGSARKKKTTRADLNTDQVEGRKSTRAKEWITIVEGKKQVEIQQKKNSAMQSKSPK